MTSVLGIEVSPALFARWAAWLAPDPQPFFVASHEPWTSVPCEPRMMPPELRDTFGLWNVDSSLDVLWLTEADFWSLDRSERVRLVRAQVDNGRAAVPTVRGWVDTLDPALLRGQADGHRFVWWPSLVAIRREAILSRIASEGRLTSHHHEVDEATWLACEDRLPDARRLAGTFASGSGSNCFGTVMAACGGPGAADVWMLQDQFEAWLSSECARGGDDVAPGTVLVWRDADGAPVHAAITIGSGWGLEKPSQEWMTPRTIVKVADIIRTMRSPGLHLERHRVR